MNADIEVLKADISREYDALGQHPAFGALRSIGDLRFFMEMHVFAVWDFMSLLKRLQREFTSLDLPWTPPANFIAARLINDIVLGEESDDAPGGAHMSHYDLYLRAMCEVGADTSKVEDFIGLLRKGEAPGAALDKVDAHPVVKRFVMATLNTAMHRPTHEVLGSFFYGRENVIPAMFRSLLTQWGLNAANAPWFVFYLERHIQLDSERHGPAAKAIIEELFGGDEARLRELHVAALAAVRERRIFWDGVQVRLMERG